MLKKYSIVLSISMFLSFLYIYLVYSGIYRYITIYCISIERYITNYKQVKYENYGEKIIISLYTEDFNKLKPVIKSLLDQTVKVDYLYISCNDTCKIPDYIKNFCDINVLGKNYNGFGNIIPVLLNENNSDTIIICLPSTKIFGEDTIELLLEESKKHPYKLIYYEKDYTNGILIKPKFFDSDILKPTKTYNYTDWIKLNLKKTGFKSISIKQNDTFNIL